MKTIRIWPRRSLVGVMARLDPRRNARGFETLEYPDAHKKRSDGSAHQDASSAQYISINIRGKTETLPYWWLPDLKGLISPV